MLGPIISENDPPIFCSMGHFGPPILKKKLYQTVLLSIQNTFSDWWIKQKLMVIIFRYLVDLVFCSLLVFIKSGFAQAWKVLEFTGLS